MVLKTTNIQACSNIRFEIWTRCCVANVQKLQAHELKESPVQHAGGCRGACILLTLLCQPALHNIHLVKPRTTTETAHEYRVLLLRRQQMDVLLWDSINIRYNTDFKWIKNGGQWIYKQLVQSNSSHPCACRKQEWCKSGCRVGVPC